MATRYTITVEEEDVYDNDDYDSSDDSEDDAEDEFIEMCDPGEHSWVIGECRICTFCGFCTGYGPECCNEGEPERDSGDDCGCGAGDAGCRDCGVCKVCAEEAQVPPSWANMVSIDESGSNINDDDDDDEEEEEEEVNEQDTDPAPKGAHSRRNTVRSTGTDDDEEEESETSSTTEKKVTEEVVIKRKQIASRMGQEKNKKARGIIFIVGVGGADGTDIDVDNVEATFRGLNFATFMVHDPPAEEISTLIQAAADADIYPYKYQYVAFYFAGHGGKDEKDMFIVGLQKDDDEKEILYVNDHIINPLKCLHQRKISRLFFFDCCQSSGEGTAYRSAVTALKKKPKPHPGELVAYATSEGEKSFGDRKNGGIWTHHLCKNIRELNEPILTILTQTFDDVVKARDSFQQPFLTAAIGTLKLKEDSSIKHVRRNTISGAAGGKKPSISAQAVCSSLKNHCSQWSDFALELGLDDEFRDSMDNDCSKSDEKKLESAITSWIEKRTCEVSWDKIIAVAKELDLPAAIVDSLNKASKISWRKVFGCLKQKASDWDVIAENLAVSTSFRSDLKQNASFNDRRKLEKVIREWIDNKTCEVTWNKIASVAKELEMHEEAKQLESVSKE